MLKDSLLPALMYVFENYISDEIVINQPKKIADDMRQNGFQPETVRRALDWFASLSANQTATATSVNTSRPGAFRIFNEYEQEKISKDAQKFLSWLELSGIIDTPLREIIIHHALELEEPVVTASEIKWVTLLALYGQPEKKNQLALLEDMILFGNEDLTH